MQLTKTKLKQLIKEELALMGALDVEQNFINKHGLNEHEDEDQDDTYEEKYHGSRIEQQDQEDAERRYDAAERMADEAEASTASSAAAFYKEHENKIDAVLDSIDHPDKDIINILVGLLYDDANPGV